MNPRSSDHNAFDFIKNELFPPVVGVVLIGFLLFYYFGLFSQVTKSAARSMSHPYANRFEPLVKLCSPLMAQRWALSEHDLQAYFEQLIKSEMPPASRHKGQLRMVTSADSIWLHDRGDDLIWLTADDVIADCSARNGAEME